MKRKLFTVIMLAHMVWNGTAGARSVTQPVTIASLQGKAKEEAVVKQLAQERNETVFVENNGQVKDQYGSVRNDIDFKIRGKGITVFLGDGHIHYQWIDPEKKAGAEATTSHAMYRMDVSLVGANKHAQIRKEEQQPYFEQYFSSAYTGRVHTFKKITYKDIYPNIDWTFYFNANGKLEHDFIVHPGGKVEDIRIQYGGASALTLNKDGSLTAQTPMGMVTEAAPRSYIQKGATVASAFVLHNNTLSFRTAKHRGTLVIDPTLEWGTYYGTATANFNGGFDQTVIRTDPSGNVYVAGTAGDTYDNVATTGAYQTTLHVEYYMTWALGVNQFLLKLNGAGERQWATYYGNDVYVIGTGLACDGEGNVYLAGGTKEDTAIATVGSHQAAFGGGVEKDAYLAKFDSTGNRIWATYYGGSGQDIAFALHCDTANNVYMVGRTRSTTNIASAGSHKTTLSGTEAFFLAKFNSAGIRQWGTYYGENVPPETGWRPDMCMAVDAAGNIYFAGMIGIYPVTAILPADMTTAGSYQPAHSGKYDVVLAKFNTSGVRQWATYYGGTEEDQITREGLACDKWGNVYLFGRTNSASGIATAGSHQTTWGGGTSAWTDPAHVGGDGFLVKFNSAGQRSWATYYGGTNGDNNYGYGGVGCDIFGNVLIGGSTGSNTGIATSGSYQSTMLAESNAYLAKFDSTGVRKWGTYFGNISDGRIEALAANDSGQVFIAGFFNDYYNLSTPGAHQTTPTSLYIAKIDDCSDILEQPDTVLGDIAICAGATETYTITALAGAASYTWLLPSGWTGTSTATTIDITAGSNSGRIGVIALFSCGASDTTFLDITISPLPVPVITVSGNVLSTGTFASYQWQLNGSDIPGATSGTYTATANGNYTVIVTGNTGCKGTSAVFAHAITALKDPALLNQIKIFPKPAATLLHISAPIAGSFDICSMEGRVLKSGTFGQGSRTIDIKDLADGMYLIRITDKNRNLLKTEKLVKQ